MEQLTFYKLHGGKNIQKSLALKIIVIDWVISKIELVEEGEQSIFGSVSFLKEKLLCPWKIQSLRSKLSYIRKPSYSLKFIYVNCYRDAWK